MKRKFVCQAVLGALILVGSATGAFNLDITRDGDFKARREALIETFQRKLVEDEKTDILEELETVRRNTEIAGEVGYSGTPHIVVGKRVLHGYSRAAIRIMLKEYLSPTSG